MPTPIFVAAAVLAARAAAKRTKKKRRVLAMRHHVGLWDWVMRFLRIRGRNQG